jgi:hypothetical protein
VPETLSELRKRLSRDCLSDPINKRSGWRFVDVAKETRQSTAAVDWSVEAEYI